MMLQSVDGVLHLFPCWPASPASFTRLRTKGAFLVSASYNGKSVTSLKIESTNGGICKLQNPWAGKQIKITEEDVTVSYKQEICSFQTQKDIRIVSLHKCNLYENKRILTWLWAIICGTYALASETKTLNDGQYGHHPPLHGGKMLSLLETDSTVLWYGEIR